MDIEINLLQLRKKNMLKYCYFLAFVYLNCQPLAFLYLPSIVFDCSETTESAIINEKSYM